MTNENEEALDQAYENGFNNGREEAELENSDDVEEARKEAYDQGYAEALENAVKAVEGLQ